MAITYFLLLLLRAKTSAWRSNTFLSPGDLVLSSSGSNEDSLARLGWSHGSLLVKGSSGLEPGPSGMFPIHQCWQPDPAYYMAGRLGAESLGQPVEKWAQVSELSPACKLPSLLSLQAKQSLEAQLTDELALRQGQVVKITHIIDKDWFRSWTNINIRRQQFSRKSGSRKKLNVVVCKTWIFE